MRAIPPTLKVSLSFGRSRAHDHADAPHPLALLRARRERPRRRRATEQRDEVAASPCKQTWFSGAEREMQAEAAPPRAYGRSFAIGRTCSQMLATYRLRQRETSLRRGRSSWLDRATSR